MAEWQIERTVKDGTACIEQIGIAKAYVENSPYAMEKGEFTVTRPFLHFCTLMLGFHRKQLRFSYSAHPVDFIFLLKFPKTLHNLFLYGKLIQYIGVFNHK